MQKAFWSVLALALYQPASFIMRRVLGDAFFGELERRLGIQSPYMSAVFDWALPMVPSALAAAFILWVYHLFLARRPSGDASAASQERLAEELRLAREEREHENDPFTRALAASMAANRRRPEDSRGYSPVADRVPLLYFIKNAESNGWDISGVTNLFIADLLDALRQAGLDGVVVFFGRSERQRSKTLAIREPLHQIPSQHWEDFEISLVTVAGKDENFDTSTCKHSADNIYEGAFIDLHLDGLAGQLWLRGPGEGFKSLTRKSMRDCRAFAT